MPRYSDPVYKHQWYMKHKDELIRRCKEYHYTPFGKLVHTYSSMRQRVLGQDKDRAHKYKGFPICTRKQFYNRFLNDPIYLRLFKVWKINKYPLKLSPSIDRINNEKGYSLDNIQFLTQSQNRRKERC